MPQLGSLLLSRGHGWRGSERPRLKSIASGPPAQSAHASSASIGQGFAVVAICGALMLALNVRMINTYD